MALRDLVAAVCVVSLLGVVLRYVQAPPTVSHEFDWRARVGAEVSVEHVQLTMPKSVVVHALGQPNQVNGGNWCYGPRSDGFTPLDVTVVFSGETVSRVVGPTLALYGRVVLRAGDSSSVIGNVLGSQTGRRDPEWLRGGEGWCFQRKGFVLVVYVKGGICEGVALELEHQ